MDVLNAKMKEAKKEHEKKINENKEQVQAYKQANDEMKTAGLLTQAARKRWTDHKNEADSLQRKINYERKEKEKNEANIPKLEKDL